MPKRGYHSGGSSKDSDDENIDTVGSPAKIQELDMTSEIDQEGTVMTCSLPPHAQLKFTSIDEFDVHYAKEHTNRCSSCRKNFPSAHFLSLHQDEQHNPLREELAAKGEKTYACFIENCDRKCSTPQKRRRHLIDKHMFPSSYNFRVVDKGIDRSISLLHGSQRRRLSTTASNFHRRKSSTPINNDTTTSDDKTGKTVSSEQRKNGFKDKSIDPNIEVDQSVDGLEKSMAALKFVPQSLLAKQRPKILDKRK